MIVQLTTTTNKKEEKQCSQVDMDDAAADFLLWTFQTEPIIFVSYTSNPSIATENETQLGYPNLQEKEQIIV